LTDFHQLADDRSLEEQVQRQDDLKRLAALLSQLNARERELVSLKYGAALTNRAIAAVTGLSESNVGTILNRTVQKLRDEWEVVQ
jgi:RNA polymerase sigma-70 factor (ECF subfamily)